MTNDDDLPDVGPPLRRREYVIGEVEWLVRFPHWPDDVAERLGYLDARTLQMMLARWGRPDLAAHFERWRYDGNVPSAIVTLQLAKRGRAA